MEGFLHSDLNKFYATVELLHHPELRGKPVAVVGDPEKRHGILLTATQEVKSCGVETAMPVWQVKQLCPDVIFLPSRIPLYMRYSRKVHKIYSEYTDRWTPYGSDEACLDVRGSMGLFGTGEQIAHRIRERVKRELGLTVSIGVSFNKTFAKLASEFEKPDAVSVVPEHGWREKVFGRDVSELIMVGRKRTEALRRVGIKSIGDLANTPEQQLRNYFGKWGSMLWALANGRDTSAVPFENNHEVVKSIGNGCTTPCDLTCDEDIQQMFAQEGDVVAAKLRANGFVASTIQIGVRSVDLECLTRQRRLPLPTAHGPDLERAALDLFRENWHWHKPVRSIVLSASGLLHDWPACQTTLWQSAEKQEKTERLDAAMDRVNARWADGVRRCITLRNDKLTGANNTQNHLVPMPESFY